MAAWRSRLTRLEGEGFRPVLAVVKPSDCNGWPNPSHLAAVADVAVADASAHRAPEPVVSSAYVHWHDPDTVSVHPFKDTPLGDVCSCEGRSTWPCDGHGPCVEPDAA